MIRKTFFLSVLLISGLIRAQVGINTENPQGVFHLDGQGNTSGATNASDDVIVTSSGDVGIGTLSPTQKLEVRESLRIADGTQADGYVFTAVDANGKGEWRDSNIVAKTAFWQMTNTASDGQVGVTERVCAGNASYGVTDNIGGFSALDKSRLQVPAGKYLLVIGQDLSGAEYGIYRIRDAANNEIFRLNYVEFLTGAMFVWEVTATTVIHATYQGIDMSAAGYQGPTSNFTMGHSNIMFLSLN